MFCNEEDLKNKVLLPYIADLGFQPSDIAFEKNFTIRLGRGTHELKSEGAEIRGRLDILCKKGSKNLFLIEVKAEDAVLDQADIDQGISYARQLDNIPPFVIVTNGRRSIVVDSIKKTVLNGTKISEQSEFWKNDCTLNSDEEIAVRYWALKHFVSFSDDNLKSFCSKQIADRMSTLTGSIDNRDAKYNPATHVGRIELEKEFRNFLDSKYHIFAVLGESGVGKTNSLCHLCIETSASQFVLFYNAGLLNLSLLETVSSDINLYFSGITLQDKVLTALSDIAASCNKKVVIFIDAIDESRLQHLRYELSELSLRLKSYDKIKVCLSCKSNLWQMFLTINGTRTYLYNEAYRPAISDVGSATAPGFLLRNFDDQELSEAIEKYRKLFGLRGEVTPTLKEELRNGFVLQVVSQVYSERDLPAEFNDRELLESYLQLKLNRVEKESRDLILRVLIAAAKLMLEKGQCYRNEVETVSTEQIAQACGLGMFDALPEELFSNYFLIRTNELLNQSISFYFSKVRDYLLVEYAYNLRRLPPSDFEKEIPKFFNGPVGFSAMHLFTQSCTPQQRLVLEKHKKFKISEYLYTYSDFLRKNFSNTKTSFDPFTNGEIGILIPASNGTFHGSYALFPMKDGEESPSIVELEGLSSVFGDPVAFEKYHAQTIHGSYLDLVRTNTKASVLENINGQLKSIIENETLNEIHSRTLDIEKIVNIIYYYRKQLDLPEIKDYFFPRLAELFPINLEEIKDRIHRFFAIEYYKNEYLKKMISEGAIPVVNNSATFSEEIFNLAEITEKAEKAILDRIPVVPLSIGGDYPPFVYLNSRIDRLLAEGVYRLDHALLPTPDIELGDIAQNIAKRNGRENWIPDILAAQFSDSRLREYITMFFNKTEMAYTELVNSCFPLLKNDFPFYKTIPHKYYVHLVLNQPGRWSFSYGCCRSPSGAAETTFFDRDPWGEGLEKLGLLSWSCSGIDRIFEERMSAKPMVRGFNTRKVDEKLVLRKWVYELIRNDLEALGKWKL